jgi:3-oxoacyl-[acyl-carrier protein] reductase
MGAEISRRLAGQGADLAISYAHSKAPAEQTTASLTALGLRAVALQADLTRLDQIDALIAQVTSTFGRLDVLVNCVGLTRFIDFEQLDAITETVWDEILDTNLKGAFFVSRAAGLWMRQQAGGVIVNVASTAAFSTRGSSLPYNVAKAGVVQMTRVLAQALAPSVRVNCVAPGTVPTRWWDNGPPGAIERATAASRFKRLSTAEDVADAALLLVQNESLSGQTLVVDLATVMH